MILTGSLTLVLSDGDTFRERWRKKLRRPVQPVEVGVVCPVIYKVFSHPRCCKIVLAATVSTYRKGSCQVSYPGISESPFPLNPLRLEMRLYTKGLRGGNGSHVRNDDLLVVVKRFGAQA